MTHENSDDLIRDVLTRAKTFVCVGASANPARPSHYVSLYLMQKGYRVIPVNPGLAGQTLFGEVVQPDLASIDEPVDVIDIFRRSEAVPDVVDAALSMRDPPGAIWTQIGVSHAGAAEKARAAGLDVIQNRCPKVEYPRLIESARSGSARPGV